MRLLLLVAALLGVWCQNYTTTATLPQTTISFDVSITGNLAHVVVSFVSSTALGYIAMGWSGGTMSESDIFFCEQSGVLARHWTTSQALAAGTRRGTVPGGVCNSSVVGGSNVKTMTYTRSVENTTATERPISFGPSKVIFARGSYPYQNHNQARVVSDINIPAPPGTVSAAPTAAPANAIPGYPMVEVRLGGRLRIAWQVVGTSIRFAFDATGCTYVALGFQDPASVTKMTGDAIVATSDGNMILTKVTNGAPPTTVATGTYWTDGNVTNVGGYLRGEFTRTAAAPQAGAIPIDLSAPVRLMVAYGTGYPSTHTGREEVSIDLMTGAATSDGERSPAVAPKVVAIVILGILCLVGFVFTLGFSHTKAGRFFFFRRVCSDSQFLGPRTPACFDVTWGQATLVFVYFCLITLFSRLEFGEQTSLRFLRAMGWTSTLTLACASIPVSRHSVLLYFFGMSFERAILIHRIFARTAILIILMHFIAVLTEPQYQPFVLSFPNVPPYDVDPSLGFWAFLCLLVMGATSIPIIRRKFFELFYYSHHLFIVVWILAILHNKSLVHQLTLLVPLGLWVIDRLVRFYRGRIRQRDLVSATIVADALRLEFRGDIALCTPTEAGSYAFINVPGVSWLQWHPFSISSRSGTGNFTFHIKNMGPGTYTGALHSYFAANQGAKVRVNVDGPYGRSAVRFEEYESILLVAGGVGVTPMSAILDDLYEKCKSGKKPPKLERVTFCWSVQAKETLGWMEDIIKKIQANPSPVAGVTFDVQVFVSRSKEASALYQMGRPKLPALFEAAARPKNESSKEWSVGVLACGPEAMVVDCQKQSMEAGYDFHKEIFSF